MTSVITPILPYLAEEICTTWHGVQDNSVSAKTWVPVVCLDISELSYNGSRFCRAQSGKIHKLKAT